MKFSKTLKKDEWLQIDEEIDIVIVEVNGDQVRIGVRAPRSLQIYRNEIASQFTDGVEARVEKYSQSESWVDCD